MIPSILRGDFSYPNPANLWGVMLQRFMYLKLFFQITAIFFSSLIIVKSINKQDKTFIDWNT